MSDKKSAVVSPRRPKVISAQSMGSPLRKELNTCPRRPRSQLRTRRLLNREIYCRHATPDGRHKNHLRTGRGAIIEEKCKQRLVTVTHRTAKANRCNTIICVN